MNRILRGAVSVVLAGGLAAGSAVFATDWLHDRRAEQVAAQAEPLKAEHRVDRVVNALEGVADDGVYVAPDARDLLDAKGERRVARAIARSETPVKVVVWTKTSHAGASLTDLRAQLASGLDETGESGAYLVWEGPEQGDVSTYGPESAYLLISPYEEFVGEPAVTIPRLVRQVDEQVEWTESNEDFDYYGGVGGGIGIGALYASGALLGIGLVYGVIVLITKRRLPGTWRW